MNPIREWSGLADLTARETRVPQVPGPEGPAPEMTSPVPSVPAVPASAAPPMRSELHDDVHATLHWHFVE